MSQADGKEINEHCTQTDAFLNETFTKMGLDVAASSHVDADQINVDVTGVDADILTVRSNGTQTTVMLDALAHVAKRVVFQHHADGLPVVIDAGGYRAKRSEMLETIGSFVKDKLSDRIRRIDIYGLDNADRRTVHRSLDQETTQTEGVGWGIFRRLSIRSKD